MKAKIGRHQIRLGLVICQNLVEANGGSIAVESKFGAGTVFWVYFPVYEADL